MAECLGLLANLGSLIGTGLALSRTLYDFATVVNSASSDVRNLATDISLFCAVLKQVKAASQKGASTKKPKSSKAPAKTISTTKKSTVASKSQQPGPQGSAILKREEMKVNFDGMRVVLIGDTHELPILDWSVKKFGVEVRDWSGPILDHKLPTVRYTTLQTHSLNYLDT